MSLKKNVLILGFGEMGHAFQTLLKPLHKLTIWNRSSIDGETFAPLEDLAPKADIIIFCLPAKAHDSVLKFLLPLIKSDVLFISIAKGVNESSKMALEIFKEYIENYCLIYGPMISEEICADKMGFAQFACSQEKHYERIEELFKTTKLYLQRRDDIVGISWSVILKNVYALAFGMIDELELGRNIRGFLTVMALSELDRIAESLGGEQGSSYGLAGLGDLITTGSSEDSRHHALGRRIARGDFSDLKAEGTHTLLKVAEYKRFTWWEYPLFAAIRKIIRQELSAKEGIESLFNQK